jgi:hypothetical protein
VCKTHANLCDLSSEVTQHPKIYLALTDDWELRGNGSGDVSQLQFAPLKQLLSIYGRYGVRSTFNVEVMQQLTFRKSQDQYPELERLADEWDDHVREAFKKGQDIQLHIHPQWSKAHYENGKWRLSGEWSLLDYDADSAWQMLSESKKYLEDLIRPLDATYRCVSFRSGSSCIAPSSFALDLLARLGIVFDMSIVGGLRVNTAHVQIDYTHCEESFLPFYPRMTDARKVSDKPEPIVCVPIFHFYLSRYRAFRQTLSKTWQKAGQRMAARGAGNGDDNYASQEWAEIGRTSTYARIYDKAIKPSLSGKYEVGDTSRLDYGGLREMLDAIRAMARASGLQELPVILTSHSKYIEDYDAIERFVREVSSADDMEFATLGQLATKLQAGEFPIKVAAGVRNAV